MTTAKSLVFFFDGLEVREREFAIIRGGEVLPVEPRAFRVLVYLLRHPQRLITKEELLNSVWDDAVVTENSLARSILKLRQGLGDDARTPRYIETVATMGYRFLCPVEVEDSSAVSSNREPQSLGNPAPLAGAEVPSSAKEPATPAARTKGKRVLPWTLTGLATAALLAFVLMRHQGETPRQRLVLSLRPPENGTLYWNAPPAVSPDGRSIAFGAVVDGVSGIWVHDLNSGTARSLRDTEGATVLAWSPDGHSIAFASRGSTLQRVEIAGGPARTICQLPNGFGGVSWGANDTIMFTDLKGTWRVPEDGGTPALVAALDPATEVWHTNPWFLPDGRHFLVAVTGKKTDDSAIYAGDIDSKAAASNLRRVFPYAQASFTYAQGQLLFLRNRTLMAQPFDPARLQITGEAVPIAEGVDNFQGWTRWGVSPNGILAYTSGAVGLEQLTWYDRAGKEIGPVGPHGVIFTVAISPDGSTVAFDMADESIGADIWLHDLARGSDSRFTTVYREHPVWSPDGINIAYLSRGFERPEAYRRSRFGGGEERVGTGRITDWSSDGRYLMMDARAVKTGSDLWVVPRFGDRHPSIYLQTEFNELEGRFSPDVHWVAYASDETGRFEVYVQGFPTPSEKYQISNNGGESPVWSRDGKEMYFVSADNRIMAAEVSTVGGKFHAGIPRALFATRLGEIADPHNGLPFDVSNDGHFLLVTPQWTSGGAITVVINWDAGLKK